VLEVFDELSQRGVELRILHAALPSRPFRDEFERHPRLFRGGLQLRMCPRVHLKPVIVDGTRMYLGSANWTGAGLGAKGEHRRNFELGVITEDESWLDQVQGLYEHVWRGSGCKGCKLRDECEAPLDLEAPASAAE
jgi:phosphatidylserine/phosphatidylglycerophosphate/cardiolipin synthase-like enzyme